MTKTFTRIFTIADFQEEETWLREQSKAGWKLVKMTPPCWYTFEKGEPEEMIYRLDYKNEKLTPEYKQMFEDFGWEYFGQCAGWFYFRKPASEITEESDGELFSDKESKAELIGHVIKTRMLPLMTLFFCCSLLQISYFADGGAAGPLRTGILIVFACLFAIYVFLMIHCGFKLRKLRAEYAN